MQTLLIASLTGDLMEAAILLLVFVFVELGLTVWLLARHKIYLDRVKRLETMLIASKGQITEQPMGVPNNFEEANKIIANATPEELEAARKLMDTPAFTELMLSLTRANDV